MCYTVYKYQCGHARKEKKECRRRGSVSGFIKRVLHDEVCERVDTERRSRVCRACSSNDPESGQRHRGRRERSNTHRYGRSKTEERSHRSRRGDKERSDHNGSRRRDRDHDHDSHRSHRTQRSRENRSDRDRPSSKRDRPKEPQHSESSSSKRSEPRRRRRMSESNGYATPNQPEAWKAAQADPMTGWMNGCEEAGANAYQAARAPSVPDNRTRGQYSYTANSMPSSGTAPASHPEETAHPSNTGYTPARANWIKPDPFPKTTYQPSVPPRPASSVYPDAPPPPPLTSYSPVAMSEFETVYVDTEVGAGVETSPPRTDFTHPSSVPQPLFSGRRGAGTASKTASVKSRPTPSQGFTPSPWPQKPPPGKSRYANLPATESEFCRQEDRKARVKRAEEEARKWEEEQNAELRKDQAMLREAMREFEYEQKMERERQEEKIRQQKVREQQQQQQRRPYPRTTSSTPAQPPMRPSTADTPSARQLYASVRPDRPRTQTAPQVKDPRWDAKIRQNGPDPTPSTVGSQFLMNPRAAPTPRVPPPPPPNQFKTSLDERRMSQVSQWPSVNPANQGFHTVDPNIVKASWGTNTGQSRGKRSQSASKPSDSKNSASVSTMKELGRGFIGKFYQRKEPSDESFVCIGAKERESMGAGNKKKR